MPLWQNISSWCWPQRDEERQKEREGTKEIRNRSQKERNQRGSMRTQHAGELTLFYHVLYMCYRGPRSHVCMLCVTELNGEFNLV